jgi:hypothetical protein
MEEGDDEGVIEELFNLQMGEVGFLKFIFTYYIL